jgi:hypothetical protein
MLFKKNNLQEQTELNYEAST